MAPAPSCPPTRPRILPSPVLVWSQSSLQPQEIQLLRGCKIFTSWSLSSPVGPGSGPRSPTVRRGEDGHEWGEDRVDSPWGPWLPGRHRPCCVLAPRAPRFQLPGRLWEGDQSVASASSDVSLCPVATACPSSWTPPPGRPATPSEPRRTSRHQTQGPVSGWADRRGPLWAQGVSGWASGGLGGLAFQLLC